MILLAASSNGGEEELIHGASGFSFYVMLHPSLERERGGLGRERKGEGLHYTMFLLLAFHCMFLGQLTWDSLVRS